MHDYPSPSLLNEGVGPTHTQVLDQNLMNNLRRLGLITCPGHARGGNGRLAPVKSPALIECLREGLTVQTDQEHCPNMIGRPRC